MAFSGTMTVPQLNQNENEEVRQVRTEHTIAFTLNRSIKRERWKELKEKNICKKTIHLSVELKAKCKKTNQENICTFLYLSSVFVGLCICQRKWWSWSYNK